MARKPRITRPLWERFMAKVEVHVGACWIWHGSKNKLGYGHISRGRGGEGHIPAHRASYEHFNGPIPDGLVLDHLCRNPSCVNPAHLEPVTQAENIRRGHAPNLVIHREGVCKRGHPMTPENRYRWPARSSGTGYCRVCHKVERRKYDEKSREKNNAKKRQRYATDEAFRERQKALAREQQKVRTARLRAERAAKVA